MELLKQFINEYGMTLLYAILTTVGSYVAIAIKNAYTKYVNDKTKKAIAQTVVTGVQQMYKGLSGPQKLDVALSSMSEMLAERGITVSELEMRILLEAALGEVKNVFKDIADDGNITEDLPEVTTNEDVEVVEINDEGELVVTSSYVEK